MRIALRRFLQFWGDHITWKVSRNQDPANSGWRGDSISIPRYEVLLPNYPECYVNRLSATITAVDEWSCRRMRSTPKDPCSAHHYSCSLVYTSYINILVHTKEADRLLLEWHHVSTLIKIRNRNIWPSYLHPSRQKMSPPEGKTHSHTEKSSLTGPSRQSRCIYGVQSSKIQKKR